MNDYQCIHQLNLLENINSNNILRKNYGINKTKTKRLKCWYSNVTSLNNKLDLLAVDLYSNNIDIAFITENWWTASSL